MKRSTGLFNRLTMAALVSALAAVLVVAVGPGFAEKPEDAGTPSENASEQASEATADDSAPADDAALTASEDGASDDAANTTGTDVAADAADNGASEEALADAGNGNAPDVPPGQADAEADAADVSANGNAAGHDKINEDTSQTGLPRGQEEDECTNEHDTDDDAEFPGHGANRHGLYDDTCDGRASENGSGGGNATGRPCMGCVGNADDKNPHGQSPNRLGGRDHNAGYECDRNKGVGQGNPAHTDCRPTDIITICHSDDEGDTWSVITDTRDDIEDILAEDGPTFAFVVDADTDPDECEEEEPPCKGKDCKDKEKIRVCHSGNGKHYVIIEVSFHAVDGHGHADHEFDIIDIPADWTVEDCFEEDDEDFAVCHVDGDDFDVLEGLTRAQRNAHLADHDDDFEILDSGDEADCGDEDERPGRLTICHSDDGENWSVLTLSRGQARRHLRDHSHDKVVSRGTSPSECEEETELCPPGSDLEGRPMPADGVCDVAQTEGGLFCPKNSDLAGMPVPNGNMVNCYEDTVLPKLESRPGVPPAGTPGRPPTTAATRGGLLPFTGASVLAFLVLALQLIAAGSLILRGKRA